jgi:uncharacterized protein
MRKLLLLLAATTFCVAAPAAPPTEQSIDALLDAAKTKRMADSMIPMMVQSMRRGMEEALEGKPPTPDQQRAMDQISTKYEKAFRDSMAWDKMRPLYIQVYRETFTQGEIDGLIAFYKSPTGAAFIDKMPTVLQKTQGLMQQRIGPIIQQMNAAIEQAVADGKPTR